MLLFDAVLYARLSLDFACSSSVITFSLALAALDRCCFEMKQMSNTTITATRQPENTPKISASLTLGKLETKKEMSKTHSLQVGFRNTI